DRDSGRRSMARGAGGAVRDSVPALRADDADGLVEVGGAAALFLAVIVGGRLFVVPRVDSIVAEPGTTSAGGGTRPGAGESMRSGAGESESADTPLGFPTAAPTIRASSITTPTTPGTERRIDRRRLRRVVQSVVSSAGDCLSSSSPTSSGAVPSAV